jgi:peptidyl-prolyl cis-trans isomerase D
MSAVPDDPSPARPATGGPSARPEIVSTLGIQVSNKYITVEDILRSAAGALAEIPRGLSAIAFRERAVEIIDQAIQGQIQLAAVLPEAESKVTEEETKKLDAEVDKTLRAMIDEAGGSRKKLEQVWIDRGSTLDQVLKEYRNHLLVMHYLQSKFEPDIKITRRMLYDYYLQHKADKYTRGRKVQMQVLAEPLVAFQATNSPTDMELTRAKDAARKEIESADAAIHQGVDFTQVVKARSKGLLGTAGDGTWPLMEAGNFREAKVEEAAFSLGEGQVSGVIETAAGFYVVKAVKVEPGETTSFEVAQEEIEESLRNEQGTVLRAKYLSSKVGTYNRAQENECRSKALEKAVEKYWRR